MNVDGLNQEDADKASAIIRELQLIRMGMLDHYQAATILERLVRQSRHLPMFDKPADS